MLIIRGLLHTECIRKDTGSGFHEFLESSQSFLRESHDVIEVST